MSFSVERQRSILVDEGTYVVFCCFCDNLGLAKQHIQEAGLSLMYKQRQFLKYPYWCCHECGVKNGLT